MSTLIHTHKWHVYALQVSNLMTNLNMHGISRHKYFYIFPGPTMKDVHKGGVMLQTLFPHSTTVFPRNKTTQFYLYFLFFYKCIKIQLIGNAIGSKLAQKATWVSEWVRQADIHTRLPWSWGDRNQPVSTDQAWGTELKPLFAMIMRWPEQPEQTVDTDQAWGTELEPLSALTPD